MFSIREIASGMGEIVLGTHREKFEMPLHYWRRPDYEKQWTDACRRISEGADRACFITGMYDPRSANFIQWWPVWRVGDQVRVQNQVLFLESLSEPFNESAPYLHVSDRKTHSEDGDKLSEWVIPRAAFKIKRE